MITPHPPRRFGVRTCVMALRQPILFIVAALLFTGCGSASMSNIESESHVWADEGDRQLFLDTETVNGGTLDGSVYCNSGFPCAVSEEAFSRLSEPAQKTAETHRFGHFAPAIGLERALTLVKAYVLETNQDTSIYYLKSIDLKLDGDGKGHHWEAQWVPRSTDGKDDGFVIRVDMDRTITRIPPEK